RIGKLAPRALVVAMADPDVEVRVNPGTGKDAGQLLLRRRARLGHRDRPQLGMRGETAVQRAEEWPPAALEVLPRVFAVEDDRDDGFPALRSRRVAAPW